MMNDEATGGTADPTGEAWVDPQADRAPTTDEEQAAETAAADVDIASVTAHEEEMARRGANVRGEGQIEPE